MHSEHFEKNRSGFKKKMNFLHLVLSAQNVPIFIILHQKVCNMNCAIVLCTKLSKKWFLFTLLTIFQAKIAHFVLSDQNTSIRIKMHQNVYRMNCANVLCTKLPKKWFLLHLKWLKLMNYFCHFDVEDPVHRGRGSKLPKILSTWFVHGPLPLLLQLIQLFREIRTLERTHPNWTALTISPSMI